MLCWPLKFCYVWRVHAEIYLILSATLKKILKFYTTRFLFTLYAMHLVTINKRWISRNEQKYLSPESWVIRISKSSFGGHLAALILVQNLIKKALLNFTRRFIYKKN